MESLSVPLITSDPLTEYFPADSKSGPKPRQVPDALYSYVEPTRPTDPCCLTWSKALAASLGWPDDFCDSDKFLAWMSGQTTPADCRSFATNYGGHQFGQWAGQLGDGRAIHLGRTPCLEENARIFGMPTPHNSAAIQLKGAGITPYARFADGQAVLRSSLREYVCSEAMFALGIPTTRALSLVLTGRKVSRDPLYNGHTIDEPGAVVCRVAPSFFRFGHLELLHYRQRTDTLKQLVEYLISTETQGAQKSPPNAQAEQERFLQWFELTGERTLNTVMHWMRVGFVHGVMNTDNFSTLGLTIDYGPFGFLSAVDGYWTPNTTDLPGRRYAYGNQVEIAMWNLLRLAESLRSLVKEAAPLNDRLNALNEQAQTQWRVLWQRKLGLPNHVPGTILTSLIQQMFDVLEASPLDFTVFFRQLPQLQLASAEPPTQTVQGALNWLASLPWASGYLTANSEGFKTGAIALAQKTHQWLQQYRQITAKYMTDVQERITRMHQENPVIVPRHHLLQNAIDAVENQQDTKPLEQLMRALATPYERVADCDALYLPPQGYTPHEAVLSCSS